MGMGAVMRSRVTPGVGSTIAMRRPASQLNSDDLPTLGLPTIATCGTAMKISSTGLRLALAWRHANAKREQLIIPQRAQKSPRGALAGAGNGWELADGDFEAAFA